MKSKRTIDVHHVTRVEGHGNISIRISDGELIDAKWEVVETPRFFEAMLRGMSYDMAPLLTSRICGICSIGHTLASLRAVERGMHVKVPKIAQRLRFLAKHGETIQSHILHLVFLAAPDVLGFSSVLPIIEKFPDVAAIGVKLKALGNDISDLVAGRTTHPVSLVVGGLSKAPEKKQLETMKTRIQDCLNDVVTVAELCRTSVTLPHFVRETEFVSLKGKGSYPWIGGDLVSSDGVVKREDEYLGMTNEYKVDFSTSKFTKLSRESFAAGALARLNNNYKFLRPEARKVSEELKLEPVNHNPYMNNIAQLVETYHVMLESIDLIEELLDSNLDKVIHKYAIREGEGIGAVEVPRGILYHHYKINKKGKIRKANCIIPTTQNNANIHYDLKELVKQEVDLDKDDDEIRLLCEMLVRAYDPCISCSVH